MKILLDFFITKAYAWKIMMKLEDARKVIQGSDPSSVQCREKIKSVGGGLVDVPSECLEIGHIKGLVSNFIDLFFFTTIPAAMIAMIWGAYQYLTAYGNEEKAQRGKMIIVWAIVGLVVAILAWVIVFEVRRVLGVV